MIERCDGCAWWKAFDDDVQPEAILGGVAQAAAVLGLDASSLRTALNLPKLGVCRLFECSLGDQLEPESKLAVMRTGTGEASIATQADFGCVQWKARA